MHPLMWSHYGDSHRGVCFEFDATQYFFQFARQVAYEANYPSVDPMVTSDAETNQLSILTKAEFWRYEKEWRVIMPTQTKAEKIETLNEIRDPVGRELCMLHDGPGIYTFPSQALTRVILGAQISAEDETAMTELVRQTRPDIRIDRVTLHESSFSLQRHAAR
jgi:hypothetical protein